MVLRDSKHVTSITAVNWASVIVGARTSLHQKKIQQVCKYRTHRSNGTAGMQEGGHAREGRSESAANAQCGSAAELRTEIMNSCSFDQHFVLFRTFGGLSESIYEHCSLPLDATAALPLPRPQRAEVLYGSHY